MLLKEYHKFTTRKYEDENYIPDISFQEKASVDEDGTIEVFDQNDKK